MACATLIHTPTRKRPIDTVESADYSPAKCNRPSGIDFTFNPAAFGSPSRLTSSHFRDTGRISPRQSSTRTNSPAAPPACLTSSLKPTQDILPATAPDRSVKVSPDREPRYTAQQVIQMCRAEFHQLDDRLKHEYDQALQDKLVEQYQSFLQYLQDQQQTHLQGVPQEVDMSYIS